MKTKIILTLVLIDLAFGGYIPIPMPVPMYDGVVYQYHKYQIEFNITDPNGPEGLTISVTPPDFQFSDPVITIDSDDPTGQAKIYHYKTEHTFTATGQKNYAITATDSMGTVANQQMKFDVRGNAPHVFTGCRVIQ